MFAAIRRAWSFVTSCAAMAAGLFFAVRLTVRPRTRAKRTGSLRKIEALYMDLGTLDAGATGQLTTHSHFTASILRAGVNYQFHWSDYGFRNSSRSLAMFAAIRRASSLVNNLAADRRTAYPLVYATR
jgi:hypothetical protein